MNCSTCEPLLSAYVDGTLNARERAEVEAHVRQCAPCRALTDDLAALRSGARSLDPLVPPARVWHRLSNATVRQRDARGWQWFGWRPLTAVAMSAVIATGLWRVGTLLQPVGGPSPAASLSRDPALVESDPNPETEYTVAIARLEAATSSEKDALDPETADAINTGMTVIDHAITESRAAMQSEPESAQAQDSLFEALRRKVALLQEMLALINEMRKGNEEGAARILSEMNR